MWLCGEALASSAACDRHPADRALDRAFTAGELPLYSFGTWRRVRRDDLERWIETHRQPARGNGMAR